ncbi:class I SAM-dependent methyltransferase, partial [bacterium]|nr:class I SAM-dependent methyltransferase [bacterium]
QTLDFIYIDANHTYESAKEDIQLWYPKIKVGGMISGHDYIPNRLYKGKEEKIYQFF